jgi:hypothetical protein
MIAELLIEQGSLKLTMNEIYNERSTRKETLSRRPKSDGMTEGGRK